MLNVKEVRKSCISLYKKLTNYMKKNWNYRNGGKEKNEDSTGVKEGAKVVSRDYMIQKYGIFQPIWFRLQFRVLSQIPSDSYEGISDVRDKLCTIYWSLNDVKKIWTIFLTPYSSQWTLFGILAFNIIFLWSWHHLWTNP